MGGSTLHSTAPLSSGASLPWPPLRISQEESRGVRVPTPGPILVPTLHLLRISKIEGCNRDHAYAGSVLRLAPPPEDWDTCDHDPPGSSFLPPMLRKQNLKFSHAENVDNLLKQLVFLYVLLQLN